MASSLENCPTDLLGHRWRDKLLQPWNHNREALCLALIRADVPSPDLDELTHIERFLELRKAALKAEATNLTLESLACNGGFTFSPYYPAASKTLWLAAHKPAEWEHLRGRNLSAWLAEIDAWSLDHIAKHELPAAVQLARLLRTEHHPFMTLPRPESSSSRSHAGNSPCPPN